ncbi:trypsin-like peptidase domain-containing protein [Streptomyces sp. NBC_00820]|uniref:S1C family serine protease n=1 Tax=Streptomyces sp. NBC_00820 TaxID=2975842 RepID=UPI002ED33265|nr:trypsin-like peptidase domain-containing protein [Streptomyces sp. NBC_00820]
MNEGNPTHVPAREQGERGEQREHREHEERREHPEYPEQGPLGGNGEQRQSAPTRDALVSPAGHDDAPRDGDTSGGNGPAGDHDAPGDGDFELAKPAPVGAGPVGADFPEAAEAAQDGSEGAAEQFPERLKPLHDPDPYSTPPYGEPGPWAPAPPVQHPSATPARGTVVPAPMPAAPAAPEPAQPHAHAPAPAPAPSAPQAHAPDPAPSAPPMAPLPPSPSPPPSDEPWRQRYDPWAGTSAAQQAGAQAPLQQTGAAVLTDRQRKRRAWRLLLGGSLAIALVAGGIGGVAGAWLEREGVGDIHLPQAAGVPAGRAPDSVAGIAARALPSVVTLHVSGKDEAGTGTGFVLDTRGHILTNNHVVAPASSGGEISVTFSSGDTAKAKVVGRDSGYDLAVVQVSGVSGLTPMPLGNSDDVRVGDPVVAIGAPFDLANTVTSGIISAKERPITAGGEKGDGSDVSYVDALQTDAPINPGNSGGPLLDTRGRVIGINSAIRSADGGSDSGEGQAGSIGLGFAIPVNQARRVAEELINEGRATHPVIGVTLDMGYTGDGARIGTKGGNGGPAVARGGPGARAGLAAGDVITEVDGEHVHSGEELIIKIRAHRPGDRLRLTVEHGGVERDVPLALGASEQN